MVCQYKKICKGYKCKAKVFTQMSANLSEQIGTPDLLILFTNTVSHKMVRCAVAEAEADVLVFGDEQETSSVVIVSDKNNLNSFIKFPFSRSE